MLNKDGGGVWICRASDFLKEIAAFEEGHEEPKGVSPLSVRTPDNF